MTVATTERKQSFTTNGVTVNFPFTFKATDENQIYCQYTPDGGNTADYTNFTVVLQEVGGTVTTNDVLVSGTLLVYRIVPLTQNTDYVEGGRFPAESHEAALDKLTLIDQDQQEDISRALKGPIGKDNPYTLAETLTEDELLIMRSNEIKSSGTTIDDLNNAIDNANNAAQNAEKVLINLPSGQWAAGITFNSANEFMNFNGVGYTPLPTTTFPYVTQGNDPTQAPDNAFVQPFSNINSSSISTYTDLVFDSVADMIAGTPKITWSNSTIGTKCSTGGTAWKQISFSATMTIDNFKPLTKVIVNDFGLPTGVDDTAVLNDIVDRFDNVQMCDDTYLVDGFFVDRSNVKLKGVAVGSTILKAVPGMNSGIIFQLGKTQFTGNCDIGNFSIEGNNDNSNSEVDSVVGFRVGSGNISFPATRNSVSNVYVTKVHDAWQMSYAWSNNYKNISGGSCWYSLNLIAQVNNIHFDKFIALNHKYAIRAFNSEGVEFSSPLFQNSTATAGEDQGIELFQSNVVMTNPYFENFSEDGLAVVGTPSESETSASYLKIIGGESNTASNNILKLSNYASVSVEGLREAAGASPVIVGSECAFDSANTNARLGLRANSNVAQMSEFNNLPKKVYSLPVNNKTNLTKGGGGGGTLTTYPTKDGYLLAQVDTTFRGPIIPYELQAGRLYTLVYSINTPGGTNVTLRLDRDINLPASSVGDRELIYLPVLIGSNNNPTLLISSASTDIEIGKFDIYEGCYLGSSDFDFPEQYYFESTPTSGSWKKGDRGLNKSPNGGDPEYWLCYSDGTPGTWVAIGSLP